MKILIAPCAARLRNGNRNPKNFPYWSEVCHSLKQAGHELIQVGVKGDTLYCDKTAFNLGLDELKKTLDEADMFISVDTFLPHAAWYYKKPKGIVLWGPSDPKHFGHNGQVNLHSTPPKFRPQQFQTWEEWQFDASCFAKPDEVIKAVQELAARS